MVLYHQDCASPNGRSTILLCDSKEEVEKGAVASPDNRDNEKIIVIIHYGTVNPNSPKKQSIARTK